MPRTLSSWVVVFGALIGVSGAARPAIAQVEGVSCVAEPTDMAITYGSFVECGFETVGDTDTFRFSATASEMIVVHAVRVAAGAPGSPCLSVTTPSGTNLGGACFASSSNTVIALITQSGLHTILVTEFQADQTPTYRLSLERVGPPSPTATPIQFGQTLPGTINPQGDIDLFSFGGTAGQTVSIVGVTTGGAGAGTPCLGLYRPDGANNGGSCFASGSNTINATLTQTGPHTIYVSDFQVDQAATFNLTLQCLAACPPPPPPPAPTITINSPTTDPTYTAPGASVTLEGATTSTVTSIAWTSDRGYSGFASGESPWYATDIPLVAGVNALTVTATGPGGTASDTLSVTVTTLSYFLAEGATGPFFDLDLALANPNDTAAPITITFFRENDSPVTQSMTLPPTSSDLVCAECIAGLESTSFSTVVTSTSGLPLVVERTMRWSDAGQYGSHTDKATATTARRWYFAEGSQGFFFTYLLLANANASPNRATVDWLIDGAPVVQRIYNLAANSRTTIDAGADASLVNRSFGIVVTFDLPAAAERAMYFGAPPDVLFKAGHESAGVNGPSRSWLLPEGATGPFFETFILLANPNPTQSIATLTFLSDSAPPVVRSVTIAANGRQTVNLEALSPPAPELANAAVATQVLATLPIIVERAQYWPFSPPQWYEAHNSFGLTTTATRWGLAEGRVGNPANLPPAGYQTFILLANPGSTAATVTIRFLRRNGTTLPRIFSVAPNRRVNVSVAGPGSHVPELADETFGAEITSDQPIAVERAMYGNAGGQVFAAGSNATATRLP
jgi:hypothetical protein